MPRAKMPITALEELPLAAKRLLQVAGDNARVFALTGPMGSGKTTFVKEVCRQLGSSDNFSSPTYSIVNEYAIANSDQKIYHIDLYRVKDIDEALALGIEDYLAGEDYCFIEWPELIVFLLPLNTVKVDLAVKENMREISIFIG